MIDILFFLPSLSGGGAERTLVNIANGLNREKYNVHFLVIDKPDEGKYKDEYSSLLKADIHIHNLEIKICKRNYPQIVLRMGRLIKTIKPEIVMSTMLRPNLMLVAALKTICYKGKVILRESNNRSATNTTILERLLIKYCYGRYADKVVALSEGVKKDLSKNFKIPSKCIHVIYNPIDIEAINELKNEPVELKKGNTIVAAGRLTSQKNYPCLITALALLKKKCDFNMYILGKGELEQKVRELIKKRGLENNVFMLGFQNNPYKYFVKSDVFVLSSDWEGFGHVIVEAMACGTAVVSTNCPYGPDEIISNYKDGILVPVQNPIEIAKAIMKILKDNNLKERLVNNGLKRAQDFSRDKIVLKYEELFDDVLRNN